MDMLFTFSTPQLPEWLSSDYLMPPSCSSCDSTEPSPPHPGSSAYQAEEPAKCEGFEIPSFASFPASSRSKFTISSHRTKKGKHKVEAIFAKAEDASKVGAAREKGDKKPQTTVQHSENTSIFVDCTMREQMLQTFMKHPLNSHESSQQTSKRSISKIPDEISKLGDTLNRQSESPTKDRSLNPPKIRRKPTPVICSAQARKLPRIFLSADRKIRRKGDAEDQSPQCRQRCITPMVSISRVTPAGAISMLSTPAPQKKVSQQGPFVQSHTTQQMKTALRKYFNQLVSKQQQLYHGDVFNLPLHLKKNLASSNQTALNHLQSPPRIRQASSSVTHRYHLPLDECVTSATNSLRQSKLDLVSVCAPRSRAFSIKAMSKRFGAQNSQRLPE